MEVSIEDVIEKSYQRRRFAKWLRRVSGSMYNMESVMKALKMIEDDEMKTEILRWGIRRCVCSKLCDDVSLMSDISEIVFEMMHRNAVPEWISRMYFEMMHEYIMEN